MESNDPQFYSQEKYILLEEGADYKSEYIEGQIIPMAGSSTNHNQIALNLSTELNFAFKRQNYRVYIGDIRLWIAKSCLYTYPDVMVIAGDPEYYMGRTDTITNPLLIAEVLSKSTKGYDKEDKFEAYRTIASFVEYLLIDQTKIYVQQFSKTGKKRWSLIEYDFEDEEITLASVSLQIKLVDLYNKVNFELRDNQQFDSNQI